HSRQWDRLRRTSRGGVEGRRRLRGVAARRRRRPAATGAQRWPPTFARRRPGGHTDQDVSRTWGSLPRGGERDRVGRPPLGERRSSGGAPMPRVTFPLDPPYDVVVGREAIGELRALLPASTRRAAVVTQPGIGLQPDLAGLDVEVYEIGTTEQSKS